MSVVRDKYAILKGHGLEDLIDRYNVALQKAYDRYLGKEISFEDTHVIKVRSFFTELGLAEPSLFEVNEFRMCTSQRTGLIKGQRREISRP